MRRWRGAGWVALAGVLVAINLPTAAVGALVVAVVVALVGDRRSGRDRRTGTDRRRKGNRRPWRLRRPWPPSEKRPRWVEGHDLLCDLWDDLQRRPRRD